MPGGKSPVPEAERVQAVTSYMHGNIRGGLFQFDGTATFDIIIFCYSD